MAPPSPSLLSVQARWLVPIEREVAGLLVELLRAGTVERAQLTLDEATGAVRLLARAADGSEVGGLLAMAELPLP